MRFANQLARDFANGLKIKSPYNAKQTADHLFTKFYSEYLSETSEKSVSDFKQGVILEIEKLLLYAVASNDLELAQRCSDFIKILNASSVSKDEDGAGI